MFRRKFIVALMVGICWTAAGLAQPPRTRPDSGAGDRPGVSPNETDWPRLRQPGQRSSEGQRSTREGPRATIQIDPNIAPPNRNWFLGVYPERSPRGVRLGRIVGGSPAHRFGLEVGDYILDVGGYVVGEYRGRYYPLSMAMDYGVDPNGWAEILVWNKRTYAEETMWIQFARR